MDLVAGTDNDLVTGPDPIIGKRQLHLGDAAGQLTIQKRLALVIRQGGTLPVISKTLLEEFVDGFGFQIIRI